ncbi:MAG TPA: regulatory protein RecX [Candidatus Limnocylindrales bacterium]|nr:regulatory protein RecX [Candidatus Limnocylindrales bacterium]
MTDRNRRQPGSPRESFADKRARHAEIDDPEIVLAAALRLLEVRQRSVVEVRRRLTQTGYRSELIEGAIEKLLGLGILDDAAFAQTWVESRDRARPRGERALRRELQVKGIDRAIVDESMEARRPEPGGADDPDVAAAEALMQRHASALARIGDPRKRRQRAYALLARHGFDSEIASLIAARVTAVPAPGEEPE